MSCVPGCRWLARAVTFGPNTRGDFYSPRCGPSLVQALPLVPVGCVPAPDGRLVHREGGSLIRRTAEGLDVAHVVGWIEQAWATADGVSAVVHLVDEAVQIRRVLLELERAHRLHTMGLSICGQAESFDLRGAGRTIRSVAFVSNVDFVSTPVHAGNHLRRRLPCSGVIVSMRGQHIAAGHGVGAQPGTGLAEFSSRPGMALFDVNGGS